MKTFIKKALALVTASASLLGLAGCQGGSDSKKPEKGQKTVTVTTSFLYDMVQNLSPEKSIKLEMIIPAGEDPHLYVPKPEDLVKLKEADLVLYHGLHFEGKMVEALEQKGKAVSEKFPAERLGKMDEDGHVIIDPHFWFDLELYGMAADRTAEALAELLPEKAEEVRQKLAAYKGELDGLDKYIREQLALIPEGSRYLITPHDAFNYFSRAYGVPVFAPQGVSTDSEVAVADIKATADFIAEHQVKAIFAESTTDPVRMKKIQESLAARGYEVKVVSGEGEELFSDSLAPAGQPGDSFISMYKHNIDLIVKYLK